MAQGDQANAQNIVCKAKGWNPSAVPAPAESLRGSTEIGFENATFTRSLDGDRSLGKFRGDTPSGQLDYGPATESPLTQRVPFNHPDVNQIHDGVPIVGEGGVPSVDGLTGSKYTGGGLNATSASFTASDWNTAQDSPRMQIPGVGQVARPVSRGNGDRP